MRNLTQRLLDLPAEKRALLAAKLPPLSFAQQRMWFFDHFQPGSHYYNMPAAVQLRGALDLSALRRSFGEIISRHEVLRSNIVMLDGQLFQFVNPAGEFALSMVDLGEVPP